MALCTHCGSTNIRKLALVTSKSKTGSAGFCKPCAELLNRIAFNDWKRWDGKVGEAHPEDVGLLMEIQEAGLAAAEMFDLPLKVVEHKRRPNPGGALGVCYTKERRIGIAIRLREGSIWQDERLPASSFWDALAQQLAYLRYPQHYSPRCKDFTAQLRDWIQEFREDLT